MRCEDLRVNIQDALGDRILAGELLTRDDTSWAAWEQRNYATRTGHEYQTLSHEDTDRLEEQEADSHVSHVFGEVRRNSRRKFPKGPRMGWGTVPDACRIYGSLEGNKVQGDFQITARGHGYSDGAPHLDHTGMSFPPLPFSFSSLLTSLYSFQLHPHDQRTLFWSSLPQPDESARQDYRRE